MLVSESARDVDQLCVGVSSPTVDPANFFFSFSHKGFRLQRGLPGSDCTCDPLMHCMTLAFLLSVFNGRLIQRLIQ